MLLHLGALRKTASSCIILCAHKKDEELCCFFSFCENAIFSIRLILYPRLYIVDLREEKKYLQLENREVVFVPGCYYQIPGMYTGVLCGGHFLVHCFCWEANLELNKQLQCTRGATARCLPGQAPVRLKGLRHVGLAVVGGDRRRSLGVAQ